MPFVFFITVAIAGGLGGLIHIIRSFTWYVGNRSYVWSWVPYYLLLPVVGALAGTVFYLVLRAGLFSPQAFEKLRDLAANIFTRARRARITSRRSPDPGPRPAAGEEVCHTHPWSDCQRVASPMPWRQPSPEGPATAMTHRTPTDAHAGTTRCKR